jgi:NAD(P)-dependent dehydrogenase (short-subunit alcohol dehydrogenase family)
MQQVEHRTAFVTGAASGIGLGIARACLKAGMQVVVADVREEALSRAVATLGAPRRVLALTLDVTDRQAMQAAAATAEAHFGPIHVLCNNAGVGMIGGVKSMTFDDWDWCMAVNLGGVINGIQVFLPHLLAHGQGGHIVNTASIGALSPGPGGCAYLSAKAAVLVLSEALRIDLLEDAIGVTVLVPGPTQSEINQVGRLRPERYSASGLHEVEAQLARRPLFGNGLDPDAVGEQVLQAIREDLLFVFTHPEFKPGVAQRFQAILRGFPDTPVDPERAKGYSFPLVHPLYAQILAHKRASGSER